jgi:hypothetical protein
LPELPNIQIENHAVSEGLQFGFFGNRGDFGNSDHPIFLIASLF